MKMITVLVLLLFSLTINAQQTGSFKDSRDGRVYKTVTYGDQVWMAENLDYEIKGAGYYLNAPDRRGYGRLYTPFVAVKACPSGWHLPIDEEWTELEEFLIKNGFNYDKSTQGNKIAKSLASDVDHWSVTIYPGVGHPGNSNDKNNSSGFNAFPAGYKFQGKYADRGKRAYFWTSTNIGTDWYYAARVIKGDRADLIRTEPRSNHEYSIRCVKD